MTVLDTIQAWITQFPQMSNLKDISVDFTEPTPGTGGIMPGGLVEISRSNDICGNTTVQSQYNFTLYFVFAKSPEDKDGAEENARFLLDFQAWVQEQSALHKAPTFGDVPMQEKIKAQSGTLVCANNDGTAIYTVQLAADFVKKFTE